MTPAKLAAKEQDIYINREAYVSMKKSGAIIFLLYMTILTIPEISSYEILGGDIFLMRPDSPYMDPGYVPPEYLSVEDLIFYTCIEERNTPVKSTVICMDDNSFKDIKTVRWLDNENCWMGTYNLDQKDCRKMIIQSEYIKDEEVVTLQKEVKVNRLSSVLDLVTRNQYTDGGWKNAEHTAAGIWVLSNYPKIFDDELSLAVEWLKKYRNNEEKCWPNRDCSALSTAKIMAYLTLAGYNDTYRIIHDGLVYLANEHNFYLDDDLWNLTISPFESGNTSCIISYEKSHLNDENFSILENDVKLYKIDPEPNDELLVICDQNVLVNLSATENDNVFIYEGDNLSYNIPNNCWSKDHKWGECDHMTTLFALMTNVSDEHKDVALEYMKGELKTTRSGTQYLGAESINESALFTYIDHDEDVISWIRYKQNNNGSWGNGSSFENIITTGYSLMGLLASGFNRTDEVIEDAEKWVNQRELEFTLNLTSDYAAWNSTEKNSFAFTVLRNNARPVIKSNPQLIIVDQETMDIEIFNPTTFRLDDVTFKFSTNLEKIMEIEPQDHIPPYSYVKLTITKKQAETGNVFGHLSVYNYDNEIGKIPVMIANFPKIEMTSTVDDILVFGTTTKAEFTVVKTGHSFDCTLSWDDEDISSKSDFTVNSNTLTVDITFKSAERIEQTYKGTFFCTAGDTVHEVPVTLKVSRYSTFPFSVEPDSLLVNRSSQDTSFIIQNKLDETLDVTVKFLKNSEYFELSRESFAIDPNNDVNISIYNNAPANLNLTLNNNIEVAALGQKKDIIFRATIIAMPEQQANPLLLWGILLIIVIVLSVGGYLSYTYRDIIKGFITKGSKIDDIKVKIKKLEEKEKNTAIMNMVKILRVLKKDDIQIRARLKEEGFSDEEIDTAMSEESEETEEADVEEDLFSEKSEK